MTFQEAVEIYKQKVLEMFGKGESCENSGTAEQDKLDSLIDGLSTATTVKEIRQVASNLKEGE